MSVIEELRLTRLVKPKDRISRFFRSQSKWELLLLVAANKGSEEFGIWSYIDMLVTRTESQMTIYNFIKDRIDDGSFLLIPGRKKSRKVLGLSPELEAALSEYLTHRYGPDAHMDVDSLQERVSSRVEHGPDWGAHAPDM